MSKTKRGSSFQEWQSLSYSPICPTLEEATVWLTEVSQTFTQMTICRMSSQCLVKVATSVLMYVLRLCSNGVCITLLQSLISGELGSYCDPDIMHSASNEKSTVSLYCMEIASVSMYTLISQTYRPHYTTCQSKELCLFGGKLCGCVDMLTPITSRYGLCVRQYSFLDHMLVTFSDNMEDKLEVLGSISQSALNCLLFRYTCMCPDNSVIGLSSEMLRKLAGPNLFGVPLVYLNTLEFGIQTLTDTLKDLSVEVWCVYKGLLRSNDPSKLSRRYTSDMHSMRYEMSNPSMSTSTSTENQPTRRDKLISSMTTGPLDKFLLNVCTMKYNARIRKCLGESKELSLLCREAFVSATDTTGGIGISEFLVYIYARCMELVHQMTSSETVFQLMYFLEVEKPIHQYLYTLLTSSMLEVFKCTTGTTKHAVIDKVVNILKHPQCMQSKGGPLCVIFSRLSIGKVDCTYIIKFIESHLTTTEIDNLLSMRDSKRRNILHVLLINHEHLSNGIGFFCKWLIKNKRDLLIQRDCSKSAPLDYKHNVQRMLQIEIRCLE